MNGKFGLGDEFEIQADGRVPALETGPFIGDGPAPVDLSRKLPGTIDEPLSPLILFQPGKGKGEREEGGPQSLPSIPQGGPAGPGPSMVGGAGGAVGDGFSLGGEIGGPVTSTMFQSEETSLAEQGVGPDGGQGIPYIGRQFQALEENGESSTPAALPGFHEVPSLTTPASGLPAGQSGVDWLHLGTHRRFLRWARNRETKRRRRAAKRAERLKRARKEEARRRRIAEAFDQLTYATGTHPSYWRSGVYDPPRKIDLPKVRGMRGLNYKDDDWLFARFIYVQAERFNEEIDRMEELSEELRATGLNMALPRGAGGQLTPEGLEDQARMSEDELAMRWEYRDHARRFQSLMSAIKGNLSDAAEELCHISGEIPHSFPLPYHWPHWKEALEHNGSLFGHKDRSLLELAWKIHDFKSGRDRPEGR